MTKTTIQANSAALGFQTLDEELAPQPLHVDGRLPEWLGGTLVRVTPAVLDPGGVALRHWFDGLAMLNAFTIAGGEVSYASRFLDSRAHRNVRETGAVGMRTFGSDPCRSIFGRVSSMFSPAMTDNCNVNVTRLGERWVAMTETPIAIEFDPETLATIGPRKWAVESSQATAHPHYDFARGEAVSFCVALGARSSYRLLSTPDSEREPRELARAPVREPAYMHSFALTERYAVLFDTPFVVEPIRLAAAKSSFIEEYRWKPERGSRFLIFDRESGELHRTVEADAFFTFHSVNAFQDGDELVVDLVAYDDPAIVDDLLLSNLRSGGEVADGHLRRYRLPLVGGAARRKDICGEPLELPRISYRAHSGRDYRYVWGVGKSGPGFADQLVKVDVAYGTSAVRREEGCYPGEPVLVPAPEAISEDDGVLLSVVLDATRERSSLLILDASDLSEMARVEAPQAIPFGFHGDFAGG